MPHTGSRMQYRMSLDDPSLDLSHIVIVSLVILQLISVTQLHLVERRHGRRQCERSQSFPVSMFCVMLSQCTGQKKPTSTVVKCAISSRYTVLIRPTPGIILHASISVATWKLFQRIVRVSLICLPIIIYPPM